MMPPPTQASRHINDDSYTKKSPAASNELIAIHKRVLQTICPKGRLVVTPQDRLEEVQRQRISLQAEIAECTQRRNSGQRVVDKVWNRKRKEREWEQCPYISLWKAPKEDEVSTIDDDEFALAHQHLASRLHEVRQARKIAAAYRLTGISLVPCADPEVLAFRFDVAVDGKFAACYHCFFDLVTEEYQPKHNESSESSSTTLSIRLIQHTLPAAIPLGEILQKTVGGVRNIGPLQDERQWKTEALMDQLRQCSNEIYKACHSYCFRKQTLDFLKNRIATESALSSCSTSTTSSSSVRLQTVESTDDLKELSFTLAHSSGMFSLRVVLQFKDPMQSRPTRVSVSVQPSTTITVGPHPRTQNRSTRKRRITEVEYYHDEDEETQRKDDELIENSTMLFRRETIDRAIQLVSQEMVARHHGS